MSAAVVADVDGEVVVVEEAVAGVIVAVVATAIIVAVFNVLVFKELITKVIQWKTWKICLLFDVTGLTS